MTFSTGNYTVNYATRQGASPVRGYIQRNGMLGDDTDLIEFDALISENHSHAAKVTTHPVEQGVAVSDFTRPEPVSLRIEGVITNHPTELPGSQVSGIREVKKTFKWRGDSTIMGHTLNGPGLLGGIQGAIGRELGMDQKSASAKGYSSEFFRVEQVYEILSTICETGEAVSIVTTLAQYDDMVLESFSCIRDANRGNTLAFTLEAKQIKIVSTQTTDSPKTNLAVAKKTKKKGNQAPVEKPATEPTAADKESAASRALQALGLL